MPSTLFGMCNVGGDMGALNTVAPIRNTFHDFEMNTDKARNVV